MNTGPIDLEDLQAVAELSRLSWEPNNEGEWFTRDGLLYGHYSFDVMDSDYIEAVPPSTVLALIAELLEARATIDRVRDLTMSTDGDHLDADFNGNTVGDIRAALEHRRIAKIYMDLDMKRGDQS